MWGDCRNDTRSAKTNIKFFPFVKATKPWKKEQCIRWIEACGRHQLTFEHINSRRGFVVCSLVSRSKLDL